jgi:hypothetical protein
VLIEPDVPNILALSHFAACHLKPLHDMDSCIAMLPVVSRSYPKLGEELTASTLRTDVSPDCRVPVRNNEFSGCSVFCVLSLGVRHDYCIDVPGNSVRCACCRSALAVRPYFGPVECTGHRQPSDGTRCLSHHEQAASEPLASCSFCDISPCQ